ncbi:MAG: hypothetical protein NXI24_24460 [bacterium]|nr:hypothetical protein [bacterium]
MARPKISTQKNGGSKRVRKWGPRRFLILAGSALVIILTAPYILERWIDSNLDYDRIRKQTEAAVLERTGLQFSSQGLRFHLVRGIVFNGARFIEPKSPQPVQIRPGDVRRRQKQAILARTENLALRFSILNYLRGLPPVHTIQMDAGRVIAGNRQARDFWNLFERILKGPVPGEPDDSAADNEGAAPRAGDAASGGESRAEATAASIADPGYLAPRLRFVARDIQVQSSQGMTGDPGRIRIDVQATMPDPAVPDDPASFELNVRLPRVAAQAGGDLDPNASEIVGGPLRCRGDFRRDGTGRLYFTFTETPLTFIARMLEDSPLAPLRLTTRDAGASAKAPGLRIRAGTISGDGSFDVYPGAESGAIGVNFSGRYKGLGARLYFAGGRLLEFEENAGRIRFNGGFEILGENSHFETTLTSAQAGGLGSSLSSEQNGYSIEILHRDIESDAKNRTGNRNVPRPAGDPVSNIDEDRFAIKGFLSIDRSVRLAGFAPGGRVEFDLSLDRNARGLRRSSRRPRSWDLSGSIRGTDLKIRFMPPVAAAPSPALDSTADNAGADDSILFKQVRMQWRAAQNPTQRPGGSNFEFDARGAFAGGETRLQAEGRLTMQPTPDRSVPVRLVSDLQVNGGIERPQIGAALEFLRRRYQNVRRLGYDPESRRAEDAGPLWKNQFFESDFYRAVIEGMRLRARLNIRSAAPAGTLPPELAFTGRAENGYVRIESENGRSGSPADPLEFQLKYESNLQAQLPRQDLQLRARVPENRLSFEAFTAHSAAPAAIDLRYLMGGEGILPGDLMQRTYSRLEVKARDIRLGRNRLLDIIRHEAGLPGEQIQLSLLDMTRSTDGSESSLRLRASAPDLLNVEGSGENLAGIGGSLRLRFRYPGDPGADRSLRFRIRPDGGYVPEL